MIAGEMVDCLANYFGFNDEGQPTRYFCYHILGEPGPTPEGAHRSYSSRSMTRPNDASAAVETFTSLRRAARRPPSPKRCTSSTLTTKEIVAQGADRSPRPGGRPALPFI